MKKAKVFLASLAVIGIVGGAVASKFTGTLFYTATTMTVPGGTATLKATTTTTTTAGTYYYYTTISTATATNYSILEQELQ